MHHLRDYICRAADEFRAADIAISSSIAKVHLEIADELIHLIECNGNTAAYRLMRARRQRAIDAPARPFSNILPN